MSDELKPLRCPFCGVNPHVFVDDPGNIRIFCSCEHTPKIQRPADQRAAAIAAWNRRADAAQVREECARVAENTMVTPWFLGSGACATAVRFQQHIAATIRSLNEKG